MTTNEKSWHDRSRMLCTKNDTRNLWHTMASRGSCRSKPLQSSASRAVGHDPATVRSLREGPHGRCRGTDHGSPRQCHGPCHANPRGMCPTATTTARHGKTHGKSQPSPRPPSWRVPRQPTVPRDNPHRKPHGKVHGKVHGTPHGKPRDCLLYTSPSPRDATLSRMPSSA